MTHTLTTTLASGAPVELTYAYWPEIPSSRFGPPDKASPPLPAWIELTSVRLLEPAELIDELPDCELERLEARAMAAEQQAVEAGAA